MLHPTLCLPVQQAEHCVAVPDGAVVGGALCAAPGLLDMPWLQVINGATLLIPNNSMGAPPWGFSKTKPLGGKPPSLSSTVAQPWGASLSSSTAVTTAPLIHACSTTVPLSLSLPILYACAGP